MSVPAIASGASALMDPAQFEQMQRVGKMLALSPLFPDHLRKGDKDSAIANGVLVMNMAVRLNEDPLTVAQNIYFVSGKPGWSSSYMIGKANQHGIFENPIAWEVTGEGDDLSVTAYAIMKDTGKRVEATCDMAMAKAENWVKNAKYKSMPTQMLKYRSASFLIRTTCPEVMIGIPAQVEVELGMKDITPEDAADIVQQKAAKPEPEEAVIVEEEKPANEAKEPEQKTEEPAKEEPAKEPKAESGDKNVDEHMKVKSHIENDLTDGAPVGATRQFFEQDLDKMKAEAPAVFAQVEELFASYEDKVA